MRKIVLLVAIIWPWAVGGGNLLAQAAAPASGGAGAAPSTGGTPATGADAAAPAGDRFPDARAEADRLRAVYDTLNSDSMADIDTQIATKRCQILRVNGDLSRLKDAMNGWLSAEKQYWKFWNDAETKRVEIEEKSLANVEAEQASAAALVDSDEKDREELLRRRAALQQGPQTDAVKTQMDALASDIQDADAKLAEAKKSYDAVTDKLNNSKASLTVRLVQIRQNINQLDSYGVALDAVYETKRAAAQDICDNKAPDSKQPVPKGKD